MWRSKIRRIAWGALFCAAAIMLAPRSVVRDSGPLGLPLQEALYFAAALLLGFASRRPRRLLFVAGVTVLAAFSLELLQSVVGRDAAILDAVRNGAAALTGAGVVGLWRFVPTLVRGDGATANRPGMDDDRGFIGEFVLASLLVLNFLLAMIFGIAGALMGASFLHVAALTILGAVVVEAALYLAIHVMPERFRDMVS